MFSLLGMALGLGVLFLIGLGSASKSLIALEARDPREYENVRTELEMTTVYATQESVKQYMVVSAFLISLIIFLVGWLVIDGGWDDFTFAVLALSSGAFGPFISLFVIKSLSLKKAVQLKEPILEISKNGLICHSNLCGPVQEIAWADVESYVPVLPTVGTVSSIDILHKLPTMDYLKKSRYAGNTIDIPLASLVTLLEHYSNIPADEPR